jgi:UDP-glucuronate 4-epimerase
MKRDFTYIDDIVAGIISSLERSYDYEIFNLGGNHTIELNYFIECLENELGRKAIRQYLPMQSGDMQETYADIEKSTRMLNFEPKTNIEAGIKLFVHWYKNYYHL